MIGLDVGVVAIVVVAIVALAIAAYVYRIWCLATEWKESTNLLDDQLLQMQTLTNMEKLHHIIYGITEKVALVLLSVLICVMAGLDVGE